VHIWSAAHLLLQYWGEVEIGKDELEAMVLEYLTQLLVLAELFIADICWISADSESMRNFKMHTISLYS
jgi:uncharacterized membrane protein (Fun14 family)